MSTILNWWFGLAVQGTVLKTPLTPPSSPITTTALTIGGVPISVGTDELILN